MKSQICCPFIIKFSPFGQHSRTLRQVRITICNAKHTCPMSTVSLTNAIKISRGHQKIDLNNLFSAIYILKIHPQLPAQQLRSLLQNSLPEIVSINAKFLGNFRMKVALYHAKNPKANQMSIDEGMKLSKDTSLIVKDMEILKDPIAHLNFQSMYQNIMQGSK